MSSGLLLRGLSAAVEREGRHRGSPQGEVSMCSRFLRCANTSCSAHEALLSCRRKWRIWLLLAMVPAVMTTLQGHSTL